MKILIVDDDKMIRNWLAMLLRQIPNKDVEISTASNVDEALEHCQNNEVHLVITDITMPQRTGLELLQILRESHPNISTAVLSAYDDYQYIRSAMQLGAIDYILKGEMQLTDILSVLRKVELFSGTPSFAPAPRGTLVKSNDYNLIDFLDDADSLKTFLQDINPNLPMKNFSVHVFSLEDAHGVHPSQILDVCNKTLASENIAGSTFQMQNAFWVIYNTGHQILERQKEAQQKIELLLERNIRALTRKSIQGETILTAPDIDSLQETLNHYVDQLRCRQYYATEGTAVQFTPLDRERLKLVTKRLRFLLELHRYTDAGHFLVQAVDEFHRDRVYPRDLKAALHHCITIIFLNTSQLKGNIIFASHYQDINRKMNLASTEEQVTVLIREVCNLYKAELTDTKKIINPSLKRAIEYIDQNYMHRLTLEGVAQHVFLNKSYISQMFMKQLGINFVSYLESVRIYKAQELLQNTDMSVTKIAEETGYASQSYFTKAFKKRVGMSPLKYRAVSLSDAIDRCGQELCAN